MDSTTEAISRCLQQRETRKVLEESKRFQKQLGAELLELMQQKASPGWPDGHMILFQILSKL
jgi:hypothetical protein